MIYFKSVYKPVGGDVLDAPQSTTDNGKAHSLKQANAKVLSHKATADILIHRLRRSPFPRLGKAYVVTMFAQTRRAGACSRRIRDTFQIRTHSVGANCVRPKFAICFRLSAMRTPS